MNAPACRKGVWYINRDLNHSFPGRAGGKPYEYPLAAEITDLVGREKVEYLVTCHESRYIHDPVRKKGSGQTIIYGVDPAPSYLASWLQALNGRVSEKERFHAFYYPVENSSTETLVEKYRLKGGFCVETWRGFKHTRRVEMQRAILDTFLQTIGFEYELF